MAGAITWGYNRPSNSSSYYINNYPGVYYYLNVQYYTLSGNVWVNVGSEYITNYPSGGMNPNNRNFYIWGNIIKQSVIVNVFKKNKNAIVNKFYDDGLDYKLGGIKQVLGG